MTDSSTFNTVHSVAKLIDRSDFAFFARVDRACCRKLRPRSRAVPLSARPRLRALRPARASPPRANRSHASPFPSARRDCRERDTRASAAGTAAAVVVASRRGRRGSETRRDSCAEKSCRDRARARDGRAGRRRAARDEDGPRERRAGEDEDGCRRERRARARGEEETVRARRPPPLPSPTAFDGRTDARFDPLAVARRPRALRSPSLAPRRPSNAVATSFPSIPTPFSRRRLDAGRPSLTTSPPALRHRRAAIPRVRLAPFVLFSRPPALNRDRPKEVKCPRVVVETYKDEKTGDQKKRSYVRGRPLGKGGFAVVYSMQDPSTGESFAAKARLYSRRSHYATPRARRAPFLKTDGLLRSSLLSHLHLSFVTHHTICHVTCHVITR